MVSSRERVAIVPLVFKNSEELPGLSLLSRIGGWFKSPGWLLRVRALTMEEAYNLLQVGSTYEWEKLRVGYVHSPEWNTRSRCFLRTERAVHYRRGILEQLLDDPYEFWFTVEVIEKTTGKPTGEQVGVAVLIQDRVSLPRLVESPSNH